MITKQDIGQLIQNGLKITRNFLKHPFVVVVLEGLLVLVIFHFVEPYLPNISRKLFTKHLSGEDKIEIIVTEFGGTALFVIADDEIRGSTKDIEFQKHQAAVRHHDIGLAYLYEENINSAIIEFTKSTDSDPNYWISYIDCAISYGRLVPKNYLEIISNYTKALNCDPPPTQEYYVESYLAAAYLEYGNGEFGKKNYILAIDCFSSTINYLNNDYHNLNVLRAYYNRGRSYYYRNDYNSANNDYTIVIDNIDNNQKNNKLYINFLEARGLSRYYLGQYSEAIADYNEALSIDPLNSRIIKYRALAYEQNLNFKENEHDKQLVNEIEKDR